MPFYVRKMLTIHRDPPQANPVSHEPGTVLGDHEVPAVIQRRVRGGDPRYRGLVEHINEEQASKLGWTPKSEGTRAKPAYATTHPNDLRWTGVPPGDAEHIADLEKRVAELEGAVNPQKRNGPAE